MKKLSLVFFAVALLGLGGCSSTTEELAKADTAETNKPKKSSKKYCNAGTGSRLSKKC